MDFNINTNYMLIVSLVFLVIIFFLLIGVFINMNKKNDEPKDLVKEIHEMEKSLLKDLHENFVNILKHHANLSKEMQNSLDKINKVNENKLNEIRNANEVKLDSIEKNINEKLDKSLNERLDSSFQTIGEQLQKLQNTNGQLISMSSTITDLQKSLSSIKARGVFGEQQLENILESMLPSNLYEKQYKILDDQDRRVDFAIKIPNKDDEGFIYLPIDAKFPNDKYMAIVAASEVRDEIRLLQATKELKDAILTQAKSINEKYIETPITTEFAIMFLPTEGLYAECLRIDSLANDCQSKYKVLLAGPTTIAAIINSFSVGFKFLQINKSSKEIAKTLEAIKAQYSKFGEEIDKTKKCLDSATKSTEQLAKRNEMITKKLSNYTGIEVNESNLVLGIEE